MFFPIKNYIMKIIRILKHDVIVSIIVLLSRRDVEPIVEQFMPKIRIKTIQTWMERLANVEIQMMSVY